MRAEPGTEGDGGIDIAGRLQASRHAQYGLEGHIQNS
jgi:hypothetical protein